jgi:predicted MFS family arabinose efflux permease
VAVLLFGGDHRTGFGVLLIPCLLTMIVLAYAKKIEPSKSKDMRSCSSEAARRVPFPRPFWLFLAAGALIAAGYADFPLISYHISSVTGVCDRWIPIMYALAMASNALSALLFGRMYDKVGMMPLVGMAVVVPFFTPLVFSSDIAAVAAGMLLYGVGFGAQESVMRAVIADLAPSCRRGTAFGCYNAAFGASWFLGSAVVGILYDISWSAMVLLSMGLQFAAIPLFVAVMRERPKSLEPGRRRSGAAVTAPVPPSGSMGEDLVFVYQTLPAPDGAHAAEEGASLPSGVPGHLATSEGGTSIGADLSSAAK